MHDIEPHFRWLDYYSAAEDENSPFYNREYSEFEFTDTIYGYCIHPQWDYLGSETLYVKIIFADYDSKTAILEFIGEWNDALHNDIMHLKRNVIDDLLYMGINKYILIGESVFNYHGSDDSYYEEWFEEIEDGYIVALGFSNVVKQEWKEFNVDSYFYYGEETDLLNWRTYKPKDLLKLIDENLIKRIDF